MAFVPGTTVVNDRKILEPGFRGWLALMAIGMALAPLRLVKSLSEAFDAPLDATLEAAKKILPLLGPMITVETVCIVGFALLTVVSSVLFFRSSRYFPTVFVASWLALVIYGVLEYLGLCFILRDYYTPATLFPVMLDDPEFMKTTVAIIVNLPWVLYVRKSKRVAITFVK